MCSQLMNTSSVGSVAAGQCRAGALGDGLLGQLLLIGGNRVLRHDDVVVLIEFEQVRRNSHADGVSFTAITVDFDSHDNLLARQTPTAGGIRSTTIRPD